LKVKVDGVERDGGRIVAEQVFIAIPLESGRNVLVKIIEPEEHHTQENRTIEQIANQPLPHQENR